MERNQAVNVLAQVVSDFCNSLPLSARGPLSRECEKAIGVLLKPNDVEPAPEIAGVNQP